MNKEELIKSLEEILEESKINTADLMNPSQFAVDGMMLHDKLNGFIKGIKL